MRLLLFLITAGSLAQPLFAIPAVEEAKIWGVSLRWEVDRKDNPNFSVKVRELAGQFSESMDPDCRWRKRNANGSCPNAYPEQTQQLEALASEVRKETLGYFEIFTEEKGTSYRDFDGVSQGYFLNALKKLPFPWFGDFAGDLYLSPGFTTSKKLVIGDPLIEAVSFAEVEMRGGGWMIGSVSRALGAKLRNPQDKDGKQKEDFQKIVLFASPHFDGGRLDGWATAIMVGGADVLENLVSLETYKGKWSYFGFDANSKPFWSAQLRVNDKADPMLIEVPAWK